MTLRVEEPDGLAQARSRASRRSGRGAHEPGRSDEDHGRAHLEASDLLTAGEGTGRGDRTAVGRIDAHDADPSDDERAHEDHEERPAIGLEAQDDPLVDAENLAALEDAGLNAVPFAAHRDRLGETGVEGRVDAVVVLRPEVERELVPALQLDVVADAREEVADGIAAPLRLDDVTRLDRGVRLDEAVHGRGEDRRVGVEGPRVVLQAAHEELAEARVVDGPAAHLGEIRARQAGVGAEDGGSQGAGDAAVGGPAREEREAALELERARHGAAR